MLKTRKKGIVLRPVVEIIYPILAEEDQISSTLLNVVLRRLRL
jgi:hypothetical protein